MNGNFGVLFDMDGVIVNSNPAHKATIQQFCRKHNQIVTNEFLENRLYGRTNKEWIPELFGEISDDRLKNLADEKEQMFRDTFDPEKNVVRGIIPFLDHLKENNIKMAVVTSAPGENANYILNRLSIYDYFDAVLDSSHVTKGKPDPEPYQNAAKAIGFDATQCIVFEDSVSGIRSGLRAGAQVVGVTTTHAREELDDCHLIIENFENLKLEKLLALNSNQGRNESGVMSE